MFQRVQPVIYQSSLLRRFYSRGVYQYLCPWSIRSRCFTEFVPRNLPKGWDRWPISWVYLGKYAQKTCPKFHVRAHQLGCITVYIQRSPEGVVPWPIIWVRFADYIPKSLLRAYVHDLPVWCIPLIMLKKPSDGYAHDPSFGWTLPCMCKETRRFQWSPFLFS